jgi:hypothetical protein
MAGLAELLGLVFRYWWALVIGGVFGVWGAVQAIQGSGQSAIVLALLAMLCVMVALVLAFLHVRKERDAAAEPRQNVTNIYQAPVTINTRSAGHGAPPLAQADTIGGTPDDWKDVRLWDYVELPTSGPAAIRNKRFRFAHVRGPLLIFPVGCSFISVSVGVSGDDLNSIVWRVEEGASAKMGVVLVERCSFENCSIQNIGFTGSKELLDDFLRQLSGQEE